MDALSRLHGYRAGGSRVRLNDPAGPYPQQPPCAPGLCGYHGPDAAMRRYIQALRNVISTLHEGKYHERRQRKKHPPGR